LLAGSLAEELALGEASDGCSSDLERATQIAWRMVVEFGMSPVVGRIRYLSGSGLSGAGTMEAKCSEATAREIDLEVRRIVDEAQNRARSVLENRRSTLDQIATRLIEQETIDAAQLDQLLSDEG
jgi:cell division protease FtsH